MGQLTGSQRAVLEAARAHCESSKEPWLPPGHMAAMASYCSAFGGWLKCVGEVEAKRPSGRRTRRWVYRITPAGLKALEGEADDG